MNGKVVLPPEQYQIGPISRVRFDAAKPKEGQAVSMPAGYAVMPFGKIRPLLSDRPMRRHTGR